MALRDWVKGRLGVLEPEPDPVVPVREDARWVPGGEVVDVAGFSIPGMVYSGRGLRAVGERRGIEPALLDGSLPVDARRPDWDGARMGYWPSYHQIPPPCRAAYLTWLAGGRQSGAAIGYVFLFIYGLERRALADRADQEAVRAEAVRLLELYGEHRSFRRYAAAFLDHLDGLAAHEDGAAAAGAPPQPLAGRRDLPARMKIGLGELAAAGRPVGAPWALAWVRAHPQVRLRTPARRCPEEFGALFTRRYADRYGAGLALRPGDAMLTLTYRPASASFDEPVEHAVGGLPEVTAPPSALVDLVEECTRDLDRYSRWLARHPEGAGTPEALARLPRELRTVPRQPVVLDADRIEARTAESEEVAKLLAAVFADDEPEPATDAAAQEGPLGLDGPHRAFLDALLAKPVWTRAELTAEAAVAGVLPAGALDTLNEAALDAFGEPLCEPTGDGVELNPEICEELGA